MRGLLSYLKKSRVALAAAGVGMMLAGTTALSSSAHADWDGHGRHGGHDRGGDRHWDRGGDRGGDRGDHYRGGRDWDRGERHWRGDWHGARWHEGHHRHYYPAYRTGYVYYPGYGYYDPAYYEPAYYPAGVSFGFNFR